MPVTLFWMFSKVTKCRSLRTFLSLGKRKIYLLSKKQTNHHWFDIRFAHSSFLCWRRAHSVPLIILPLGLKILLKNSWFITCDYTTKEILLTGESVNNIKTLVFSIVTNMLKTIPIKDFQISRAATKSGNNVSIDVQLLKGRGITLMFEKNKTLIIKKSVSLLNLPALYMCCINKKNTDAFDISR